MQGRPVGARSGARARRSRVEIAKLNNYQLGVSGSCQPGGRGLTRATTLWGVGTADQILRGKFNPASRLSTGGPTTRTNRRSAKGEPSQSLWTPVQGTHMHFSLGGASRRHDPPSPPSPETGWAALESRSRCSGLSGRGAATVKNRARWLASTVRGPACERLYKEGADPSGLRASRGLSAHATTSPLPIEHALGGSD